MFFLVKLTKMQSTAGETRSICHKGPFFMNDEPSANRDEHVNNFTKITMPIYTSLILTRSKSFQSFMMSSGTQQIQKSSINCVISVFWHKNLPFNKLIRLCDGLLCVIIIFMCMHTKALIFYFWWKLCF